MEISNGKKKTVKGSNKNTKTGIFEQLDAIKDKNSEEYLSKVQELETILGIKEVNMFGTANRTIFERKLDEMSLIQIQDYAHKFKLNGFGSKPELKKRLMKEFDTQNVASRGYFSPMPKAKELFSPEQKEKLLKVLNG